MHIYGSLPLGPKFLQFHEVFQKTGKKVLIDWLAPLTRKSGFPTETLICGNEYLNRSNYGHKRLPFTVINSVALHTN